MGYDFEVVYHSGMENKVANAFSSILENSNNYSQFSYGQPMTLSSPIFTWLDTLKEEW